MFEPGDYVYIKDTAQEDIGALAWRYVQYHRQARIVSLYYDAGKLHGKPSQSLYIVVWPRQFEGGWDCWHGCLPGYGQIVTAKNMELNFEMSREVVTVPNVEGPPDE